MPPPTNSKSQQSGHICCAVLCLLNSTLTMHWLEHWLEQRQQRSSSSSDLLCYCVTARPVGFYAHLGCMLV